MNDPDASFNALMFSKPFAAEDKGWQGYFGAGIGRFGYIYPGASTSIGFKNGSSVEFPTVGQVIGDFSGVTDGESFYKKFCNPNPPPTNTTTPTPTPSATIVPGYPSPVVVSSDFIVSGYFLNSTENSDVAVLSMITFEPRIPREFQRVIQNFLADAKAAGKTKLVIDVSANGGGIILNGYDAFRQLFPQIEQDGRSMFWICDLFSPSLFLLRRLTRLPRLHSLPQHRSRPADRRPIRHFDPCQLQPRNRFCR